MSEILDCGHPTSLLIKSVESEYQFCELCECRKERNDALTMERHYRAELAHPPQLHSRLQRLLVSANLR